MIQTKIVCSEKGRKKRRRRKVSRDKSKDEEMRGTRARKYKMRILQNVELRERKGEKIGR